MAMSTFVMTLAAIGAAYVMMRGDVVKSSAVLRRNLKQVKTWLEEDLPHESSQAARSIDVKPKHIEERPISSMPVDPQPHSHQQPQPQQQANPPDQQKQQQM
ncbi:uncharacterized protein LOC112347993 [Selaginella moellendorffii]|uniref:uncharacterized protein LOC112347993 n=1 Tax=Selaginella moellendorffii TaxID=88036 RepID=UPI000D1CA628|nr:uncharacterized protein LOC112347993 [Selaginella moellendorffii]|eukprot:XP_024535576.1 uncharacterized protein LOC112347993 [Selaginella moellendorffii]